MALAPGTRLGPYTISASIGAGGMGEVYKATDTRLDRTVAVKVLPEHVASDPDLKQRFEREAKTLAALSHPHICPIHDVGSQNGIDFLVMEYLEGETLEQRLKKGGLPLDHALQIGIQIADALAAAHHAGIIHRDLKPGNIMLTKSGVRLLDFGLAKTGAPVAGSLSMMPTTPPNLTAQGAILGTFQYMAPEQLEGREADARTDIFAFGSVLYETVTGKKAFEGKSQASLIAAILEREPPAMSKLQPLTPPLLDRVVKKCLAKTPEHRWQTARDLLDELRWVTEGARDGSAVPVARGTSRARAASWMLAVVSTAAAIAFGMLYFRALSGDLQPVRLSVVLPQNVTLNRSPNQTVALVSPDGRRVAFVAGVGGISLLWIRTLDTLEARPLTGTNGAQLPFWSPDGQALGFFSGGQLKTIEADGGPVRSLSNAPVAGGGAWNREGEIVFSANNTLFRVSANGGQPALLTNPDASRGESAHRFPTFLPDGRRFLFFASPSNTIWLGSLDSNQTTLLLNADSQAQYATPGYVLFSRQNTLVAQAFDLRQTKPTGEAVAIAEQVVSDPNGYAGFSVSENGVLAYRTGGTGISTQLIWVDRSGNRVGSVGSPGLYRDPALSPDGTRLAVEMTDPQSQTQDIWLVDLKREVTSRFTFDAGNDIYAVWSPDAREIMFSSDRAGNVFNLYQKRADGVGNEQQVVKSPTDMVPYSWSPDGSAVVYRTTTVTGSFNLGILPLAGDRQPRLFEPSKVTQATGQVSPDGRWLSYHSVESGRFEIYVQSFPAPGAGKWQISKDGGTNPRWRGDGRELFYYALDGQLMAVPMTGSPALEIGVPVPLFVPRILNGPTPTTPFRQQYDVTRDGQRFVLNVPVEEAASSPIITVVLNWTAALRK